MSFQVKTKGHSDFINITEKVAEIVAKSGIQNGVAVIFLKGTTAALTIMEYEEGIMQDIKNVLEKFAPETADYKHHKRWGDHNGAAHIKSVLIGTDLGVPVVDGKLQLGTWQSLVLIDFDEKPRTREVIVQVLKAA